MSWRRRAVRSALAATLVAGIAGTPPALARGGVYGGTTSDDEAIVLRTDAKGKKLKSAVLGWSAKCSDGDYLSLSRDMSAAQLNLDRNRRGRFRGEARFTGSNGDASATFTLALVGKLGTKRASGTLSASVSGSVAGQTFECKTSKVSWKATRAPGRVFGGSTSQDWPVVVKLDKRRRNVDDLVVGWDSESCEPDGSFHYPDWMSDFPIKNRRFGDTFPYSFDTGDGKTMFDYDLSGNVGRTAVRGAFQVKVTHTDTAGAQTYTCDTGNVSWTARTG